MAAPFKAYTFSNVSSPQTFLGNIASAAQAEGWTIDKDAISSNGELYLHSSGNGSQSLYFSMKLLESHDNASGVYHLAVQGNTGYDGSKDWLSQPGRWTSLWEQDYGPGVANFYSIAYNYNNAKCYWLLLPCIAQYVLVNSQAVIVIYDTTTLTTELKANGRSCPFIAFGAFDSYRENESEGNFVLSAILGGGHHGETDGSVHTRHLGAIELASKGPEQSAYGDDIRHHGLLYDGTNLMANHWWYRDDDTKITRSLHVSVRWVWYDSYMTTSDASPQQVSVRYHDAVKWNNWCSRSVLIKPVLTRWHQTDTDTYVYAIGEWPWYAVVHHPYYRCGEIATIGTRKFMMFPLFKYTDPIGIAVEVQS